MLLPRSIMDEYLHLGNMQPPPSARTPVSPSKSTSKGMQALFIRHRTADNANTGGFA